LSQQSKMKNIQTAVILCGGKGTRLGNLGKKIPKTLVKIQGKEILWYIIKILKRNKFNHLVLPLGYKGNLIKKFLKNNKNFNMKIDCISTGVNSNIGYRIAQIQRKIKSDDLLLLNGDAIFKININKIFKDHVKQNKIVSFLSGEIVYPYGTIGVVGGNVKDFKRNLIYDALNVRSKKKYTAYNYTGMSIIKNKMIRKYKNIYKNSKNFEQTFFPRLIRSNKSQLIKVKGFWHSVDNIKDLEMVDKQSKKNLKYLKARDLKKSLLKN